MADTHHVVMNPLGLKAAGTDANHKVREASFGAGAQECVKSLWSAAVERIRCGSRSGFSIGAVSDEDPGVACRNWSTTIGVCKTASQSCFGAVTKDDRLRILC